MLSSKNRLPYSELSVRGYRTIRTSSFSLKIKKNELPHNRIGVVIGVAAEKRAARRNFWKRQAKAMLIKQPGAGKDFIVIFLKGIREVKRNEFKRELLDAVKNVTP